MTDAETIPLEIPSEGFVDLHCHYVPAVDDGVRTTEEGLELCGNLHAAGFSCLVATPHIRTAMFENRPPGLRAAHAQFSKECHQHPPQGESPPSLGLAAEHYFDDVFWGLFESGDALPYPGGHAMLVEFNPQMLPMGIGDKLFEMNVRGVRPVIAHPERYSPMWKSSQPLEEMIDAGALPMLDLMSLVGKYGRRSKRTAERFLDKGLYFAACSDTHRPGDVPLVVQAIDRIRNRSGEGEVARLLQHNTRRILGGQF